ncbi:MAG: histidine--tRNA ligase [Clostridiales bacterium]|nr:histidine--tRNA ligase [Clostridiales bacterium]
MEIKAPKGTRDILPQDVYKWQYIEGMIAKLCRNFGFKEIRTPVFEYTELFQRGVGDTTDIVQKEMYTFNDKGGRSITLRPEGTAGVVRSFIEHGMSSLLHPLKLYYNVSTYRYENVQKGRLREHHQFGAEVIGAPGPSADIEIISMLDLLFNRLGIHGIELNINSIGCPVCRPDFTELFKEYLKPSYDALCNLCKDRYERNPMRILDCKEESCRSIVASAPAAIDQLCSDCSSHFEDLKEGLENLGIKYNVDTKIVRGQDYYTKTVFEFASRNVGTQGTVCGGGRYDGLVETCGGAPTPGIGFGLGFERLLMHMESQGIAIPEPPCMDIYLAPLGHLAGLYAQKIVLELRRNGINADTDHMGRSFKSQFKFADKMGFSYVIAIGEEELSRNKAVLRNMKTGEQKDISLDSIIDRFKKI